MQPSARALYRWSGRAAVDGVERDWSLILKAWLRDAKTDGLPFAFDAASVAIKAPIKYPSNVLCIASNYRLHAGEIFPPADSTRALITPVPLSVPPLIVYVPPPLCEPSTSSVPLTVASPLSFQTFE